MISIIICTYNRGKYIFETLSRIAKNNYSYCNYEIVFVNNNCTDSTESECARFCCEFPSVNFKYFEEKQQGLSFARNRGIKEAIGDILVFLDDDAFVSENYLENLEEQLALYPDAMAFGGKISPLYESGEVPDWMSKWSYSWVSAIDKGSDVTLFDDKSFPIGANMGFRRQCVGQVGDFNVLLGRSGRNLIGGEEKDYFNRIRVKGLKIYYFPNVAVEHVIPPNRTTMEYIDKFGLGVGESERMRTMALSRMEYVKRVGNELVKWGATCLLWCIFAFRFQKNKGNALIRFRMNVSKGLLNI